MFGNLGKTLALLREMRGYSQLALCREARIGKSQLSKYEKGRELPKLETLERVLRVLNVQPLSFFYTVAMLDDLVEKLDGSIRRKAVPPLALPLTLLQPNLDRVFAVTLGQLFRLHHLQTEVQASPAFQRLSKKP
ncbi:MAG TPA: helix-turn-helix transcriptional regulator [Thermoanaerobaculia bacterium]|nr:helix-turn-helix transcriptional regulator [Thermoanaerobaculia bacterium]